MRKPNKKGFTIVELVIVIAVVAILAAVLVPTFVSVTKRANESKDTQLVRNLNTALAVDTEVGKHETMQSALEAAAKAGYDVAKINTSATDNEILWDSKNDCFVYKKDSGIEYIPNSVSEEQQKAVKNYQYWIIASAPDATYSTYLYDYKGSGTETATTGLDVGNETVAAITYKNDTANAQEVVIRTNSFDTTVTVNAEKDTVSHFGEAGKITITAVAPHSYHEYGEVLGNVEIIKGRLEVAATATVGTVLVSSAEQNDVKIELVSGAKVGIVAPTTNNAKADIATSTTIPAESKFENIVTVNNDFAGGLGTEKSPYLIANCEQALKIEKLKKGAHIKLVADIVVTDEIYISGKKVVFDLNGHTIKLEYGADVKPNNGSVLYIGGKNGSLTINDSSEGQTGAVIGSDKTYQNKVTSAVRAGNYGKLIINGGHFYGTSEGTSCIFVYTSMASGSKATVTINGGTFETATPSNGVYFVLNHQDNATGGCTITVNGGKFKNYNPGVTVVDPVNEKTGKIVLGEGCKTTQDGEWYVVSK